MANGKRSFVLYTDTIHTFEELTDEEAGKLIKHLLRYVNDLNPEPPDKLTKIAFEPIKQQLKRDLKSWESVSTTRSEIGRLGGIKSGETRRKKQTKQLVKNGSKTKQNEHVSVSDSVSVIVNDNEENINNNILVKNEELILKPLETIKTTQPIQDITEQSKVSEMTNKPSKTRFIKPTLEEVKEYCAARKNEIDPENFINHYETVGWVVGKNKLPMRDWQAAIRTWEKNNVNKKQYNGNQGDTTTVRSKDETNLAKTYGGFQ